LKQRCTCCKSRGFDDCPLQARTAGPGNPEHRTHLVSIFSPLLDILLQSFFKKRSNSTAGSPDWTPPAHKIPGRVLDMFDSEGRTNSHFFTVVFFFHKACGSTVAFFSRSICFPTLLCFLFFAIQGETPSHASRSLGKRPLDHSHGHEQQKKLRESASTTSLSEERVLAICNRVKEFAVSLCQQLRTLYASQETSDNVDVFGKSNCSLPKRKYITGRSYASNPWMKGYGPPAPTTSSVSDALTEYMRSKCADTIYRYANCILFFILQKLQVCYMQFFRSFKGGGGGGGYAKCVQHGERQY
jgi:hypothetical protein